MADPRLLELRDVTVTFPVRAGPWRRVAGQVRAVDRVNLSVASGESLGLVGESGCGKTTLAKVAAALLKPSSGEVWFEGERLSAMTGSRLRQMRRRWQLIFQDPANALNPRFTVRQAIEEPLIIHRLDGTVADRRNTVAALLDKVGLAETFADRLPSELSGGERQRVVIARALAVQPRLLICDEPIASLDVSIGAQMLELLRDLQRREHLSYLFISHDLRSVASMAHRVAVMYLGAVVEVASTEALFRVPWHPYTELLLRSAFQPLSAQGVAGGEAPSALHLSSGCRFRARCPLAEQICVDQEPALIPKNPPYEPALRLAPPSVGLAQGSASPRLVACHKRP
ncbi:MAG: ABC transporter ATP-binding protein [Candidatus Omnitrophica bacterium]|nr:ABC transporter ATP-binding protein [Candidatus Omnitrophota bacterium]